MVKMEKDAEDDMKIYYCDDAPTPWGDWGAALIRGRVARDENSGRRSIKRVGPFTPPAYICSGELILTHPIKELLESSGLKGIARYERLEKTHIVRIDWQGWDPNRCITDHIDLAGGPSSIISFLKHDLELARQMPDYWRSFIDSELILSTDASKNPRDVTAYLRVVKAEEHIDFFTGDLYGGYFVSERAKAWLEKHCPGCFNFFQVPMSKE